MTFFKIKDKNVFTSFDFSQGWFGNTIYNGNTPNEIVHIYENVRVVTNPECTRVITVITTGK